METERDKFEAAAFSRRFISSITRNPDPRPRIAGALDFVSTDCPTKAEFVKKDENGEYAERILSAMWWAWQEALKGRET